MDQSDQELSSLYKSTNKDLSSWLNPQSKKQLSVSRLFLTLAHLNENENPKYFLDRLIHRLHQSKNQLLQAVIAIELHHTPQVEVRTNHHVHMYIHTKNVIRVLMSNLRQYVLNLLDIDHNRHIRILPVYHVGGLVKYITKDPIPLGDGIENPLYFNYDVASATSKKSSFPSLMSEISTDIFHGRPLSDIIEENPSPKMLSTVCSNLSRLLLFQNYINSMFHSSRDLPYQLVKLTCSDDANEPTKSLVNWVNDILVPILPWNRCSDLLETKRPALFISGPPSTGKTTLLTCLSSCVPTVRVPKKETFWPCVKGCVVLVLDEPVAGLSNISKTEFCDILSSGSGSGSWMFSRKGLPPDILDTPYTMLILSNHSFNDVFSTKNLKTESELTQDSIELEALRTRFTVIDLYRYPTARLDFRLVRRPNPSYIPDVRHKVLQPPVKFLDSEDCFVKTQDDVISSGIVRSNAIMEGSIEVQIHNHPLKRATENSYPSFPGWYCHNCEYFDETGVVTRYYCQTCKDDNNKYEICRDCYLNNIKI